MTRIEISWLLSSLILVFYSKLYEQTGPVYQGGIGYILIHLFFILVMYFWTRRESNFQPPRLSVFIIGVIPILFTEPLFENDHFRYLWEGKAWGFNMNPYMMSAKESSPLLERVLREKVAYPELTSVYPFLAQLYFRLFSYFPWEVGLKLMQLTNGILVFLLFKTFWKNDSMKYWSFTFLFWQKEFIQSVHIDLLSAFAFYLLLSKRRDLIGIFVGCWVKLLPLVFMPFYFIRDLGKDGFWKNLSIFSVFFIIGLILQFNLMFGLDFPRGVAVFAQKWIWNSGAYSILLKLFPSHYEHMRVVTFGFWILFLMGTLIWFYRHKAFQQLHFEYCFLAFSSMMFFSPVYNAWYSVWFLIPALVVNSRWGVFYALMGCWSYFYHDFPKMVWISEFCSHVLIFPSIYYLLKEIDHRVELHEDPPSTQNFAQKT